jgi:peptidoglycan hydrolase FlgJ
MTRISNHNAAASNQLPMTVPPRVSAGGTAEKLVNASSTGGAAGILRELNPLHGTGKSAEDLKATFTQFVGETFYSQMIKSMRSTVGEAAYFNGGQGEKVFQGQLDQQLAQELTAASASKFAEPMFERQFPHLAERPQQQGLNQLSQLSRR